MDADRVRSYLQVACAGLGFDIGEVWWMSNESGTSTVAAIGKSNAAAVVLLCIRCAAQLVPHYFSLSSSGLSASPLHL